MFVRDVRVQILIWFQTFLLFTNPIFRLLMHWKAHLFRHFRLFQTFLTDALTPMVCVSEIRKRITFIFQELLNSTSFLFWDDTDLFLLEVTPLFLSLARVWMIGVTFLRCVPCWCWWTWLTTWTRLPSRAPSPGATWSPSLIPSSGSSSHPCQKMYVIPKMNFILLSLINCHGWDLGLTILREVPCSCPCCSIWAF